MNTSTEKFYCIFLYRFLSDKTKDGQAQRITKAKGNPAMCQACRGDEETDSDLAQSNWAIGTKRKKCVRYDGTRKKCENANVPMCYAGHRKNSKFEADQNHNGVLPHEISSARWTLAFHRIRPPFQHLPRSLEFVRMHGFPPHSRVIWILERPKIAWKIPKDSLCSYRSNSSVSL